MRVNKFKLVVDQNNREIVFPLGSNDDFLDRGDAINAQESVVVEEAIGVPVNYELQRFSKEPKENGDSSLIYDFNFKIPSQDVWSLSYTESGRFTPYEVVYNSNGFKNSFFKLDLYDTVDPKKQKLYLSIILATRQSSILKENCQTYSFIPNSDLTFNYTDCCGTPQSANLTKGRPFSFCHKYGTDATYTYISQGQSVGRVLNFNSTNGNSNISNLTQGTNCSCPTSSTNPTETTTIPEFLLDHVGEREGYFIYWYQDKTLMNLDTLYMSAKFFNGKDGTYTKFITETQDNFSNRYNVPNLNFYYKIRFDYVNYYYTISNSTGGNPISTVTWYEYENPPIQ